MKIKWKNRCSIKVDAGEAYEAIEEVRKEKGGNFKPTDLVEAATDKDHILHKEFEWDNEKAGEKYREEQAKQIIRSLEIVKSLKKNGDERTVTIRAYSSLGKGASDGKESRYYDTKEVLSDEEQRRLLLLKVWNQITTIRRKYNDLAEFEDIWKAIDSTEKNMVNTA